MSMTNETSRQAHALASGRDASNRPMGLIAIASVALALALVFIAYEGIGVMSARGRYEAAQSQLTSYVRLIEEAKAASQASYDIRTLFPRDPFFQPNLQRKLREELGFEGSTDGKSFTVRSAPARPLAANNRISSIDFTVDTRGIEPGEIFALLEAIERDPQLYRSVVMDLRIASNQRTWTGGFTVRIYEPTQ